MIDGSLSSLRPPGLAGKCSKDTVREMTGWSLVTKVKVEWIRISILRKYALYLLFHPVYRFTENTSGYFYTPSSIIVVTTTAAVVELVKQGETMVTSGELFKK